jgi:hypothetical protein
MDASYKDILRDHPDHYYRVNVTYVPILTKYGVWNWQAELVDGDGMIIGDHAGWDTTPEMAVVDLFGKIAKDEREQEYQP